MYTPATAQQTTNVTSTPLQPISSKQNLTQSLRVAKWLGMGIKLEPGHIVHLLDETNPNVHMLGNVIEQLTPLQEHNPRALQNAIAVSG